MPRTGVVLSFFIAASIAAAAAFPALGETVLRSGAAKVDITPPPGVAMWGYARRKGPATGTLDPLFGRILVLEAGQRRLAIVTLDLGRCFGPDSLLRLRESASKENGISYVFVTATHTHSGLVVMDEYPDKQPPAWETAAITKLSSGIGEACGHLREARIGTGYGIAYVAHNRLRLEADGKVTWFERNPTLIATSPVDPTVSVLRIDGTDGQPTAILVNYACHPVVFGPDNLQFSADFPAALTRAVEGMFEDKTLCLYLQGAPGDLNPLYAVTPLQQNAIGMRDWTGEQVGQEAGRVAKSITTEAKQNATLDFAEEMLPARLRWDADEFRKALLGVFGPQAFAEFGPSIRDQMQLPVSTILINKRIALAGLPGEPFVDFQSDWRARCPVHDAFLVGYANGYFGYFPTIRASTWPAYGASSATTWVEPGTGERMVDHAIIMIYEMLGKLTRMPRDTEF